MILACSEPGKPRRSATARVDLSKEGPDMTRTGLVLILMLVSAISSWAPPAHSQRLFVGLEDASLATRSSNLAGFPVVTYTNHFAFEVNGAAATPQGTLYLCNGPFTTRLYTSTLAGPPVFVTTVSVDLHGLGYGNGKLYGFSNFSSPMGIYEINPATGAAALRIDTSSQGFRFFALDFNPSDGLLYGFTEYGVSGLYSINPDTGAMVKIANPPPGASGQGRGMAVGNNTAYLMCTRGDDGDSCFAYDIGQGANGAWVAFTNPYPAYHNTGGAAWIPSPTSREIPPVAPGESIDSEASSLRVGPNPFTTATTVRYAVPVPGRVRLEVLDLAGRLVSMPVDAVVDAGSYEAIWDGREATGAPAASGVYFVRLIGTGQDRMQRVVRIR
jgi:hypothetical protein